ncbi:MAG: TonB-system energizer ExbB [Thermodesulfobacteriaceae bacterium]|nr:TonB-system energizer ExbB [Thermodesulfobacteriaceae bacterium]MCX8041166.1 TonB-system energizer ExbB [Thermodesulfobacteriaceae bacterium]MDW8135784.1 TonB-system energizer ExbB [Thermodesulfobacterium sp.]
MEHLALIIDYGIIGILLFLSVIALGIGIERFFYYKKIKLQDFRDKKELEIDLTKNLYLIATIASNAPYIGLLGTVLGIMLTFYSIGQEGLIESKKVMIGLALALKATAIGLLVAIPASAIYNFLLRKVREKLALWEIENGRERI